MKIAFLTPYLPDPPDTGGKIRSFHLAKQLALRHEVDLFSVYYGPDPPSALALKTYCRHIYLHPLSKPSTPGYRLRRIFSRMPRIVDHFQTPQSIDLVRRQLAAQCYDLVFIDEAAMMPYAHGLPAPRVLNLQKIDYQHYWETARARPLGRDKVLDYLEAVKLYRFQSWALQDDYRECIVCSLRDEQTVHKLNPRLKTVVMPNGVDMGFFDSSGPRVPSTPACAPTLIYVGTMSYYPNVDAIQYFWHAIYPLIAARIPQLRLLIVGHNPPPQITQLQSSQCIVTGSVADVRHYLAQSTAMIVPLRLGGGTRLKIMEAMASGLPVVSTSVGAQGLDLQDGEDILLADDPEAFAAKAVQVLNDDSLRRRLINRGRAVAARYDWGVLIQKRLLDRWQTAPGAEPHAEPVP